MWFQFISPMGSSDNKKKDKEKKSQLTSYFILTF